MQPAPPRIQSRDKAESSGLDRVREAARKDGDLRFTALLHHADVDGGRRSFLKLRKTAAVGIDGVSWQDYEQALEEKIDGYDGGAKAAATGI